MASASVVFGTISGSGHPIIDSTFASQTVASGATSTASPAGKNYCVITPTGNMYAAFTTDGSTPNAAVDPRMYIPANASAAFYITAGTKVTMLDA